MKSLIKLFFLFILCTNIYANSVDIFSDIKTKENNLDYTEAIFSPDNQYLVYSFGKSNVYFYSINEARISFQIGFEESTIIRKIEFSPNGELLAIITSNATEYVDCIMYVYDTKEFDLLYEKKVFYYAPSQNSTLFSKNSEYIIACQRDFSRPLSDDIINPKDITLNFFDSKTGTPIKVFNSNLLINSIIVSNDNKKILISYGLSVSSSLNWFLCNITGSIIQKTEIPQLFDNMLNFTDDSKYIYSEDKVWNAEDGSYIKSYTSNIVQNIKKVLVNEKIAILSDNDSMGFIKIPVKESFYEDMFLDNVNIYDFDGYEKTNSIDTSVLESAGYLRYYKISNNNEYMCSTCLEDGSVFLSRTNWEINKNHTEKPICKISVFENDEWIALTPDGFYNASPNGDKYIHIRYNLDVYDLKQFTKAYLQPEVLIARTAGRGDPQCVNFYGDILLTSPPPLIAIQQKQITNNNLPLNIRVLNNSKKPISDISIYRNGKYLGNTQEKYKTNILSENLDSLEMNLIIELENGENYIEVIANTEICYGIQVIKIKSENGIITQSDLYILSIGINKYEQRGLIDLKHAVEDSKLISQTFRKYDLKYNNIYLAEINDNTKVEPTREEILKSFSFFEKMNENDDAIIFIAAHGVTQDGIFSLLPKDNSRAIDIEDIIKRLNFLGRKIVLIDSCMSGGIQNNVSVKTLQNKSIALLTASQENELAQESSNEGGYFTQSIISYFDKTDSELYNLSDMSKFIYDEVREKSRIGKRGKVRQNPVFFIPDGFSNFSF